MSSSEEETSPVKGHAFKAHMKDKEKYEKAKMVEEVADETADVFGSKITSVKGKINGLKT